MEWREFHRVRGKVLELYRQERYQESLETAFKARSRFPEKEGETIYWIACLKCRLGKTEEALHVLLGALEQGHWWGEHWLLNDPDLEPIRGRPEFRKIMEVSEERQQAAQAQAKPKLLVLPLEEWERPPLLIALHGMGGSAEGSAPYWEAAQEIGFLVAIPQSSQVVSEDGYGWNDGNLARREMAAHWERLQREYHLDPERVILAGASQGGRLAIELALEGEPIPARRFIAVVPAIRDPEGLACKVKEATDRGVRGWIVTGEQDYARSKVEAFCTQARAAGMGCEIEVVPGLGHDFPDDFPERLTRALDALL